MVFRRRDRRPIWRIVFEVFWPRGGWARAARYVQYRVRRLPDTPEKIGRGIWAGVFVTFSPFFGLHFFISVFLAWLMRGNMVAALLATFFGNPLTYLPIAATSLWFGHILLGETPRQLDLNAEISAAWADIWHNLRAIFAHEPMQWEGLQDFYQTTFFPFMIGGIIPGFVAATVCYYLSVRVIHAYQNRRRKLLKAKLRKLKPARNTPGRDEDPPRCP
ncbi:MAG: DUF2062 domain-containing protein [Salibaculum sp.]|uniref:DUF2062 domain-containing protein n=1 Tax=Salibaculum sp. TaxID=2855480 RepID=UPI00287051E1|nr:DUF2062 domain-containing protein [Salibaculum sp.]MDR9426839.1 DUF2062 domain-containing protein [Salibaculum sp.]MDR9481392.1 DUF2062 domain-containing protein [Salibaculum sp.]